MAWVQWHHKHGCPLRFLTLRCCWLNNLLRTLLDSSFWILPICSSADSISNSVLWMMLWRAVMPAICRWRGIRWG